MPRCTTQLTRCWRRVAALVVLPDGLGGYSHNAAMFLIDESGRLRRAYDIDRPDLALTDYLRRSGFP